MKLSHLREEIDALDAHLVELLGKRISLCRLVAGIKKEEGLLIFDATREDAIKKRVGELAREQGLSALVMVDLFTLLLDYSRLEMEWANDHRK